MQIFQPMAAQLGNVTAALYCIVLLLLLFERYTEGQNSYCVLMRPARLLEHQIETKWSRLTLRKHNKFHPNVLSFDSGKSLCM